MTGIENMCKFVGEKTGIEAFIKSCTDSGAGDQVAQLCVEKITKDIYQSIDEGYKKLFPSEDISWKDVWEEIGQFQRGDLSTYFVNPWPEWFGKTGSVWDELDEQFVGDIWDGFLEAYKLDRGEDDIHEKLLLHAGEEPDDSDDSDNESDGESGEEITVALFGKRDSGLYIVKSPPTNFIMVDTKTPSPKIVAFFDSEKKELKPLTLEQIQKVKQMKLKYIPDSVPSMPKGI